MYLHFKFHKNPAQLLKRQKSYSKSTILKLEKKLKSVLKYCFPIY